MRRSELEHLIRAAGAITNELEFIIVGSQSILGAERPLPHELTMSIEADMYPRNNHDLSIDIEGAIGELSLFHHEFGYYAQGVSPGTAILPLRWEDRLIKIQNENTQGRIGYCLDPHDLAISKLVAMRPKDQDFVSILLMYDFVKPQKLLELLALTSLADEQRTVIEHWIKKEIGIIAE